ncbi:ABC-type multidrug transport system permease subunit [Sphingobacterium zeae]|uniref:ABC-type multidrug transport system permease subunit n=1 Tax=Sphingobacterium zeae TaxID=1776859 RepID=A0ABU0UBR0_9SPHI|nr:ABC-type multidrug transport system permease subunit [Sphingobacterium zeae]
MMNSMNWGIGIQEIIVLIIIVIFLVAAYLFFSKLLKK